MNFYKANIKTQSNTITYNKDFYSTNSDFNLDNYLQDVDDNCEILYIKKISKFNYNIVDINDTLICSIIKKSRFNNGLSVIKDDEEWFKLSYKQQKLIIPGFKAYDTNNWVITGHDSILHDYVLKGTDITKCSDEDIFTNNYMYHNEKIGSVIGPIYNDDICYMIKIYDNTHIKDIIAISMGEIVSNVYAPRT